MAGISALSVVEQAVRLEIPALTFFAFSTENWGRSSEEIALLMKPWSWLITTEQLRRYRQLEVRIKFIGNLHDARMPEPAKSYIREVESACSASPSKLHVTFAFNFGGRADILAGVNNIIRSGRKDPVTEASFASHLWSRELPDVDLVVRTSGELRLSNFLLWHCHYAELIITDTLWPDFRGAHLEAAVEEFSHRQRRKGGDHSTGKR
jgi:undecaprenyl diphosphate synthase